ncbi:MAG: diacylglycerol kinase family lipid kinase [Lachnoclostridium sp.]|nr:diacylglycerol kinase family lipid kinase [Lachnoclostridium sp.]
MKALLIINPISGTANKDGLDEYVKSRLESSCWNITVKYTKKHGDATLFARQAVKEGFDAVFSAGGDGTVNETAAALCNSNTILGIIPCGSGNGLARHTGIPVGIREGVDVILDNNCVAADYMTVNDYPCFCTFGVGFDAAVSEAFARKKARGKLSYIQSTFETYQHFKPENYTIEINDEVLEKRAFLIAVCNASQYGNNAYIAPHASITDGMLDVTIIHSGNALSTALVGIDLMTGFVDKNALIDTIRTSELVITRSAAGPAHIDGEPVDLPEKIHIKCHPGKLKIFMPSNQADFKPILTPLLAFLTDVKVAINNIIHPI